MRGFFDGCGRIARLTLRESANALIVAAEQRERGREILFALEVKAYPPRVGHMMVHRGFAARNELVSNRSREGKVRDLAPVDVPDFPFSDEKLTPTETMPSNGDAGPTQKFSFNFFADVNAWFHNSILRGNLRAQGRCVNQLVAPTAAQSFDKQHRGIQALARE